MVYNQKFVVVVKVNGKVLREKGDTIHIPFGSEYSITLKNLNSTKAVAKIEVDGSDVLDNCQIIVPSNESVTIEGFMKGKKVKNKFKFIEKTNQISAFRGDKVSDGLVRVTYQFEYVRPQINYGSSPRVLQDFPYYDNSFGSVRGSGGYVPKGNSGDVTFSSEPQCCTVASPINEYGITVKGSQSDQRFAIGNVGLLDPQKHVIVLQLKGKFKNKKVYKAVTVKTKIQCETCGKKNKSKNKFCNNCGTSLV